MTQLFTVRMNRLIKVFTDAGVTERHVPEVYHDLPHATAQAYKERFGDAVVSIEPTPKQRERGRPGSLVGRDESQPRRGAFRVSNETQAQRKAKGLPPRAPKSAGADYADVVNEMIRKGA